MSKAVERRGAPTSAAAAHIMGQVTHTSALPNPISQSDPKQLHPSIRTRTRIVPVVAAMRAPPRHCRSGEKWVKFDSHRIGSSIIIIFFSIFFTESERTWDLLLCCFFVSLGFVLKPKLCCVWIQIIDIERESLIRRGERGRLGDERKEKMFCG